MKYISQEELARILYNYIMSTYSKIDNNPLSIVYNFMYDMNQRSAPIHIIEIYYKLDKKGESLLLKKIHDYFINNIDLNDYENETIYELLSKVMQDWVDIHDN